MKLLLITISALLLLPNFFNVHLEQTPQYDHKELFNLQLAYINSTDQLIATSDSVAYKNNIATNSFGYALIVYHLLKERFYHGFSRYPLNQNWIAATGEYFFGYGLASIVKPDDILKYSFGGCPVPCRRHPDGAGVRAAAGTSRTCRQKQRAIRHPSLCHQPGAGSDRGQARGGVHRHHGGGDQRPQRHQPVLRRRRTSGRTRPHSGRPRHR